MRLRIAISDHVRSYADVLLFSAAFLSYEALIARITDSRLLADTNVGIFLGCPLTLLSLQRHFLEAVQPSIFSLAESG